MYLWPLMYSTVMTNYKMYMYKIEARFSVVFYLQDHVTEQNKWISYLKIT